MDNKADAKFWRELIDWAKTLPESARLGLNDDGRTVELYGVSHDMRRHLQFLAKRGGLDNPEAAASVLYLNLRSRAAKEMALKGSSRHFHPLLYERTAYRGHRRIEERRVDGFFQPLREVLLEYCSEQLMGTTLSPAHSQLGVKDSAGKRPGKAAGRRPKPERRRAIAQAIMRHGDDWWDHLDGLDDFGLLQAAGDQEDIFVCAKSAREEGAPLSASAARLGLMAQKRRFWGTRGFRPRVCTRPRRPMACPKSPYCLQEPETK